MTGSDFATDFASYGVQSYWFEVTNEASGGIGGYWMAASRRRGLQLRQCRGSTDRWAAGI